MRETLGVLLGFFLAAVLGYLISEIAQKEQEKEVLESYMDSLQEIYEVIRQRMDVTRKFRHDLLSHVQTLEYLIEKQKIHPASAHGSEDHDGIFSSHPFSAGSLHKSPEGNPYSFPELLSPVPSARFLKSDSQVRLPEKIPAKLPVFPSFVRPHLFLLLW